MLNLITRYINCDSSNSYRSLAMHPKGEWVRFDDIMDKYRAQKNNIDSILKEADILRKEHPSKDCRSFAESVFKTLKMLNIVKKL